MPSSEPGGSAPASTGDTSALEHEQRGVRELLLAVLSASDKQVLLEGGTPRHDLSGSSGPLRLEVTLRLREILVSQYTPAARRSHLAWHGYWDRHGGVDFGNDELMAASPPAARSDHRKRVTWGQARKWVREEAAADQASADDDVASDTSPGAAAPRDTSRAAAVGSPRPYDLAAVCSEQALVCPVNGARCESIACVDIGCTAQDTHVDAGRAA